MKEVSEGDMPPQELDNFEISNHNLHDLVQLFAYILYIKSYVGSMGNGHLKSLL